MSITNLKYIIISPVRNEEKNIQETIQSVASQTILPTKWVIVDDGSSDNTASIIEKYTTEFSWISLIKLSDRGYYDLFRGGEIKAFSIGYQSISNIEFDYLVKLDGDISFNKYYFEDLFKEFDRNSRLGMASGAVYDLVDNALVFEKSYKHHVRGAARVYKRKCWAEIGGVVNELAWDVIDVYKARMLGWDTYSFEKIKMIHHVKTNTKGGVIHGHYRQGRVEFLTGTHPLFFCAKSLRNIFIRPYLVGSFAYISGYINCFLKGDRRIVDSDLMNFIRRDQLERLFLMISPSLGKKRKHN